MKLSLGSSGAGGDKNQKIIAVVAVVVLLVAVGLLARQFIGGGSPPPPVPSTGPPNPEMGSLPPGEAPMVPPGAPGGSPATAPPAGGGPPGTVGNPATGGLDAGVQGGPGPAGQPVPTPPPGAAAQAPAQNAPAPPPAASQNTPPTRDGMRQLTVFGSVNVSYPADWKIKPAKGNAYAVFTDGNASFAVHPPDSRADSAKKIALLAMQRLLPGASITSEGADKVSGRDVYWFAVKYQGRTARVVGIDGPTRIALVQTVKAGDFSAYRATFDKMQTSLSFVGN